jgi:hypothetical protein
MSWLLKILGAQHYVVSLDLTIYLKLFDARCPTIEKLIATELTTMLKEIGERSRRLNWQLILISSSIGNLEPNGSIEGNAALLNPGSGFKPN